jgi:tetratricopeptide (TPR) repeat protein
LGGLGIAYYSLGEYHRAIEFYEQQLAIVREIRDREGEGNALWNSALALDKLGDRAEAVRRAEQAFSIYEQIESPASEDIRTQLAAWRNAAKA